MPSLTTLTASGCSVLLKSASITGNPVLSTLDISSCTKINTLDCSNNALTSLNVKNCKALRRVDCYKNKLNSSQMTTFISGLPTIPQSESMGELRVLANSGEHNVFTDTHKSSATAKRWNALKSDGTPIGSGTEGNTGDVNGDGKVDISDVNIVINVMLGKDTNAIHKAKSDLNGDGKVDISDVNAVINIMLGK